MLALCKLNIIYSKGKSPKFYPELEWGVKKVVIGIQNTQYL